jgi:hypothetical protein
MLFEHHKKDLSTFEWKNSENARNLSRNFEYFQLFPGLFRFPKERVYLEISEKPRFTRDNRKHHQGAVQWIRILSVTQLADVGSLHNGIRSEAGMIVVSDHFSDCAGWGFEAVFRWTKERDPVETHRTC